LILVAYLLWDLTRSVRELKRRVERIEEAVDGAE
jgi:lipoate-protein ligase B